MWNMKKLLIASILVQTLCLSSCDKPDPNPHLADPIYLNIAEQIKAAEADLKSMEKAKIDLEAELKKADPHSVAPKVFRQRLSAANKKKNLAEQKLSYWQMRLESREKEVKLKYLEERNKGKKYDPSEDLKNYYIREGLKPK